MSSGGFLVLRRHGVLWGVPEDAVTRISQDEVDTVVETAAGDLAVDEVVGRAATVRIAQLGAYTRSLMTGTAALGVHQESCLLVVDPAHPPAILQRADSTPAAAERRPEDRKGERSDGTT